MEVGFLKRYESKSDWREEAIIGWTGMKKVVMKTVLMIVCCLDHL